MSDYQQEIQDWREAYEQRLRADFGWLSAIALSWLPEGESLLGSSPNSIVPLPADRAPEQLASLQLDADGVVVRVYGEHTFICNEQPCQHKHIQLPQEGNAEDIFFGDFLLSVIRRNGQYALRVFDNLADRRRSFAGAQWFPIAPDYRIQADYLPFDTPASVTMNTVIGGTFEHEVAGKLQFSLDDSVHELLAIATETGLFVSFKDQTSGIESYSAGRFLSIDSPKDGRVWLDFNKAHNPPCALTPYATCVLPPRENELAVRVAAGERYQQD